MDPRADLVKIVTIASTITTALRPAPPDTSRKRDHSKLMVALGVPRGHPSGNLEMFRRDDELIGLLVPRPS